MSSNLYDSLETQLLEKANLISDNIKNGFDIQRLRFWSLSRYGLVNDNVRRKAWPLLSGLKSTDSTNSYDLQKLLEHPQAKQVELDVRRMGSMIPDDVKPEEKETLILETKRLILSILAEYPDLHYYQGFHDICYTCLSVLGPDNAFAVVKQLVPKHFTVFMQKTMDPTSENLQLVFDLLQMTSPKIWNRFQALNFEPFFTLSWFLTWFTHILSNRNDIHRLYDLFVASDPSMLIYLSVSVIICSTEEIDSTSDDFGELHHALTHLPMKHDVEKLIQCALDIYLAIPPSNLFLKAEERRATAAGQNPFPSNSSSAKNFFPLSNRRLVLYGALTVLTLALAWNRKLLESQSKCSSYLSVLQDTMLIYPWLIWAFSFLVYDARGFVPMPIDGPAGSSFTRVAAWAGVDLGAFVDVNSDRRTDAVVLKPSVNKLYALMAPTAKDTNGQFNQVELFSLDSEKKLLSVAVADFNADSKEDYLLVYSGSEYHVEVWLSGTNKTVEVGEFKSQPLVCDANADMVADIYGEDELSKRVIYYGGKSFPTTRQDFTEPSSQLFGNAGFASLGTSMNPSLVLLTSNNNIEVFSDLAVANNIESPKAKNIALPPDVKAGEIGKFVFGDFSQSSHIQLLLLTCPSKDCSKPKIWISSLGSFDGFAPLSYYTSILYYSFLFEDWKPVAVHLTPVGFEEGSWSLASAASKEFSTSFLVGPSLGDFDLDGFPDLAVGLKYSQGSNTIVLPAILRNTARSNGGRVEFQAYLLPGVEVDNALNLKQIAFFDYNEDGILDLFMTHQRSDKTPVTSLYMQKMTKEVYFLKVMLATGLCGSPGRCPNGVLPYGLPGYGYRVSYETQGAEGGRIGSSASFVSTSCCGALQLPFVTFGFGDFATYIENVIVSIPAPSGQTRSHKLTFIVPNAQVVVIPYEYNNPDSWQAKSFLQPLYDIKVIVIAITLLSTCIILLVVIGILQYLEIRADQKERMQESQRFHFDAM
ncbi:unnamed protein product [Rodentolepis nana]|uniref:Rab-GAP TBC domain-containing protein n=1 Tax=Rodentolepis nana TaxID=102285 RepID=A0A0R3TJK4_RODNA|nr:unnamed protein product [Rodentolepis nana]